MLIPLQTILEIEEVLKVKRSSCYLERVTS